MTNEERDLIEQFIARTGGAPAASGAFGSVPSAAPAQPLPPVDPEADAFIGQLFTKYPEARYRITQLAFVQEHALTAAQARINELTQALNQARQAAQQQQAAAPPASPWGQGASPPPPPPQSRGFLSSLFGGAAGGAAAAPRPPQYAPPPPQYAPPQYAPGMPPLMAQQSGTGFLGGALRTAAGVAGGVVAGEALMNMFSGHHDGGFGGMGGFGGQVSNPTTIIEEVPAQASPWSNPQGGSMGGGIDPYDQGGAPKDPGYADNTAWTDPNQGGGGGGWTDTTSAPVDTSWTDTSGGGDDGGGWTDTSSSDDNTT